jgi:hypothetical protein
MLESGLSGSVRGVPSNGHPYRDPGSNSASRPCWQYGRFTLHSGLEASVFKGAERPRDWQADKG